MQTNSTSRNGLGELPDNSPGVINRSQPGDALASGGEGAPRIVAGDPFADIAGLRLNQDFDSGLALAKPLLTVPVRKPSKEWFVRVHPDAAYRLQTAVIELKEDSELYLVNHSLWPELASENTFGPRALFTAYSRPGNVVFLWPVRLPGADGKLDEWNRSALQIATTLATEHWVRISSNRALGAYEARLAPASVSWGEPAWPKEPLNELLRRAFKDRFIESLDHPVLKRLRGEV
jgi:hypothetical protein